MAAYRRVYDSHHLQADCQESGSALEPYARQSSMGYLFTFTFHGFSTARQYARAVCAVVECPFVRLSVCLPHAGIVSKRLELGPDLQNILRQCYGYLTIMPELRSTYDRRLIYKTSYEGRKGFVRYDSLAKL